MRTTIVFCLLSYFLIGAAETSKNISEIAETICKSFDISTANGMAALDQASSLIKKRINAGVIGTLFSNLEHDLLLPRPYTAEKTKTISQAHQCAMDYFQEESYPSSDWHIITTELIQHAQKKHYPLYSVICMTLALDKDIKTGWRYTIFTNEQTEKNPLKQRIICFGMTMDMNDIDHWRTQFVISPLQKKSNKGDKHQLINNI